MLAGRNSIAAARIAQWADEGEEFLRKQFADKDLQFYTTWDTASRSITLAVYRPVGKFRDTSEHLFEETCKAENFVSHLMVTKILMVM